MHIHVSWSIGTVDSIMRGDGIITLSDIPKTHNQSLLIMVIQRHQPDQIGETVLHPRISASQISHSIIDKIEFWG